MHTHARGPRLFHLRRPRPSPASQVYKWWEADALPSGVKWRAMEHPGLTFPAAYVPHGAPLLYAGAPQALSPAAEELASAYATIPADGPQLGTPKTARIFNKNFWEAFAKTLPAGSPITDLAACDFSVRGRDACGRRGRAPPAPHPRARARPSHPAPPYPLAPSPRQLIRRALDERKEARKEASKGAAAKAAAEEKEQTLLRMGYALVDGHLELMGNVNVEPPGLFRGRGEHPRMGALKRRVEPEDITINVGASGVVPVCPLPGHNWKRVVHDPTVTWCVRARVRRREARARASPPSSPLPRPRLSLSQAGLLEGHGHGRAQVRLPGGVVVLQGQVGLCQVREGAQAGQVHRLHPRALREAAQVRRRL